jgi:hypothetical protein
MPATTPIIATTAKEGKSVIACFAGDGYPLEYFRRHAGNFYLQPANPSFPTQELTIAAVVSFIRQFTASYCPLPRLRRPPFSVPVCMGMQTRVWPLVHNRVIPLPNG